MVPLLIRFSPTCTVRKCDMREVLETKGAEPFSSVSEMRQARSSKTSFQLIAFHCLAGSVEACRPGGAPNKGGPSTEANRSLIVVFVTSNQESQDLFLVEVLYGSGLKCPENTQRRTMP